MDTLANLNLPETFHDQLQMILTERDWSWAVIAMVYLVAALFIRGLFLKPLTRRLKAFGRKCGHEIKGAYFKHSLPGWIFFLIPLVAVIILWHNDLAFPPTAEHFQILAASFASFVFSIFLHTQALGLAAMDALQKFLEEQGN